MVLYVVGVCKCGVLWVCVWSVWGCVGVVWYVGVGVVWYVGVGVVWCVHVCGCVRASKCLTSMTMPTEEY